MKVLEGELTLLCDVHYYINETTYKSKNINEAKCKNPQMLRRKYSITRVDPIETPKRIGYTTGHRESKGKAGRITKRRIR